MKPLVLASLESTDGQRCVDIVQENRGFGWVECRRDPEDAHGWRRLDAGTGPAFLTKGDAEADARANVGWLAAGQ